MDNVVIGLVILNALEIETNFTTWPDDPSIPDREDSRTIMVVERIGQLGVFPQCSNLREHSVCTNSVSNFLCSPFDAHIPVSPVVAGTVHPTRSADSQEFCRFVMENSEPSASKSDLGLGITDTACLCCVAGSDWWANYKSLQEDFGLKHEIDETREAERYKFGDGGTLVSSNRVTAPILLLGRRAGFFQRGSFETPALVGCSDFLTPARAVVDMGEKTLRIGIGVDDLVVSRAGHLALRLNPQDWHREANLIEDIPVRLRARRKRQDPRTEKLLESVATNPGRRSALFLSSQQVKHHFVAESLITSTVKDALSRTPRETFLATSSSPTQRST